MAGVAQISDDDLDFDLISCLTHRDVKSAFGCIKRVASSAEKSLSETKEQLEKLIVNHNLVVKYSDIHGERLNTLDGRAQAIEMAQTEDRMVMGCLTGDLEALQSRVSRFEGVRTEDLQQAAKTVGVVNQLSKKLTQLQQIFGYVERQVKAFQGRLEELELTDQEVLDRTRTLSKAHEELSAKVVTLEKSSTKEVTIKFRELWERQEELTRTMDQHAQENEELKAQNAEMSQMIHTLVKNMGVLFEWKDKATREKERDHRLQIAYLGALATMHSKIDRLLEGSGLQGSATGPVAAQELGRIMQELTYQ